MTECQQCGGTELVDVHSFSQLDPILRICERCGLRARVQPSFRRWRGEPVHMVDPGWTPGPAREATSYEDIYDALREGTWPPTITVYCGPPAPCPAVPTPAEILASAQWLTLPGPGRADLSDHRTYIWEATSC